ncbi:MAG: PASTA domain-containing protein [Bacteroidales bacterium]|nr:MAG: PASTA domain-containing protein [Bacteroidales bacterium]
MDKVKLLLTKFVQNPYVKTVLIAMGITLSILIVLMIFLRIYTRHNQSFTMPDFRGLASEELLERANDSNLRVEISDSVYIFNRKPGSVIDQNPEPGTHVKKNRRVFITINAKNPIKVEVPNIVGYTLRQAKAILEQQGLEVGTLSFRPDLGVNNVLDQRFDGKTVDPGTLIPKGSKLNLVLGMGMHGERTGLPLLIGLKLNDAQNRIIESSLNIGKIRFDETIIDFKDSLDARVYSQYPAYTEPNSIGFGAKIDIWLTLNQSRIPKIERASIDSLIQDVAEDDVIE